MATLSSAFALACTAAASAQDAANAGAGAMGSQGWNPIGPGIVTWILPVAGLISAVMMVMLDKRARASRSGLGSGVRPGMGVR